MMKLIGSTEERRGEERRGEERRGGKVLEERVGGNDGKKVSKKIGEEEQEEANNL